MSDQREREYGIDVARIFAMFLVVLFHVVGLLSGYNGKGTVGGRITAAFSICCVDLFTLISGYVGSASRFRYSKIVNLWIQVVFTGLVIVGGGTILGYFHPTLKDCGKVCLPFAAHAYWYLNAYVFLYLLTPFLNAGLEKMSKGDLKRLVGVIFVFIVLIPSFNPYVSDTYLLSDGMSTLWLIIGYLIGALVFRCPIAFGGFGFWLLMAMVMTGVTFLKIGAYDHPSILATAFCYLVAGTKLKINGVRTRSMITVLSSCALGVYVWHMQPLLHIKMLNCFSFVANYNQVISVALMVSISIAMYLCVSVLEFGRIKLFKLLGTEQMVKRLLRE